jgi:hypothetical protein
VCLGCRVFPIFCCTMAGPSMRTAWAWTPDKFLGQRLRASCGARDALPNRYFDFAQPRHSNSTGSCVDISNGASKIVQGDRRSYFCASCPQHALHHHTREFSTRAALQTTCAIAPLGMCMHWATSTVWGPSCSRLLNKCKPAKCRMQRI